MIRIESLSLDLTAPDENFAQKLYADWDVFCRDCIEQVFDECLSPYDRERVLHEIERLDLDLGNISEEHFYREFPKRLREELLKNILQWDSRDTKADGWNISQRSSNLLHYMEYGYPLAEWTDTDFNLETELEWLSGQPDLVSLSIIQQLALLCLRREHALRRLLWQTTDRNILLKIFSQTLAEPSAGNDEKQRVFALMLEVNPDIPVRFVHETDDDAKLQDLSVLLDTLSVRQLIRTETKEYAEVDLPPYWHYLYEWLIRYYPYNGIALFGGKAEFTRHLHHRLLTFIHKRNGTSYLSKAELTVSFLLEVFGPVYYKDVLSAIYLLQPHHSNGSPVYDSYLNLELYRTFLRLSLLKLPETGQEEFSTDKNQDKKNTPAEQDAVVTRLTDMEKLAVILKDPTRSDTYKRMLWTMLVGEQPEEIIRWIQSTCTKDNTLLPLLAELSDNATARRVLATYSLATLEILDNIRIYLERHKDDIVWLKEIAESRWTSAFRRIALYLPVDGTLKQTYDVKDILCLIYREVTGSDKNEESTVDALVRELKNAGHQTVSHKKDEIGDKHNENLRELRRIICDPNLSENAKRRITACYWDINRENLIETVCLLQKQGMLEKVLELTGHYAWETILYRMLRQTAGMENTHVLMPLFQWLAAHETFLSSYRTDNRHSLRAELLLVTGRMGEDGQDKPLKSVLHFLLVSLFREDGLPIVWKQLVQDTAAGAFDAEQMFRLSEIILDSDGPSLYQEWLHEHEDTSNAFQMLFEHQWSTIEGFAEWINDISVPISIKRKMLRRAIYEKSQEWLRLLRTLSQESRVFALWGTLVSTQDLLHALAKVDFYQATVLARVTERLRDRSIGLPGSLTRYSSSLDVFLQRALLAYLQNKEASGKTLSDKEIAGTFLYYLQQTATGKVMDETDKIEWRRLAETITDSQDKADDLSQTDLLQILIVPSVTHTVLRQTLDHLMDQYPEALRTWLEGTAGNDDIVRMAEAADHIQISHWVDYLTQTPGFVHSDALRHLTGWLLKRIPSRQLATALFLYVKESNWKVLTPEQIEAYFFSRLSMTSDGLLFPEVLTDESMPEDTRRRLLCSYLLLQPEKLLAFIRESVLQNIRPLEKWLEWMDTLDWMYLAASLSFAKAELLGQIIDCLSLTEEDRKEALAIYMLYGDTEEWSYDTPQKTVRDFIGMLPSLQKTDDGKKAEVLYRVETKLALSGTETPIEEEQTEVLAVGNAGLCLLVPWFVRLFDLLGYLDGERKKFRNTASKVRAVFLLQYIAYGEERKWREANLVFNRLLTALPGNVPLPRRLHLTDEEKQTADSMMAGVKANWPQMSGTSVEGFRRSFLIREGRLEKEDERWLLSVEDKAYDVLLETIPWGFRQIRLPWLKKYVQVKWHEKQIF